MSQSNLCDSSMKNGRERLKDSDSSSTHHANGMFKVSMERFQVVILVYVDGLLLPGSKEDGVKWVKNKLGSLFKLMALGEVSYHLGVMLERQGNVIGPHQTAYRGRVLELFEMETAKSARTPMVDRFKNLFKGALTSEAEQNSSH